MATNNMASDAFKRAQNLLSPGYNKIDTFEAVTTLSKDDAQDLARAMKLDAGVTGYGNTPFKDNQASMDSYFPSINEPEAAVTTPFQEDPDEIVYVMETEDFQREVYGTTGKSIDKGMDWLGDKYNEILNGLSKVSPIQSANAGTKENFLGSTDSIYDATDYMDFLKDKEYFKAEAYDPTAKKGQEREASYYRVWTQWS